MNPRDTFDTLTEMFTNLFNGNDETEQVMRLVESQETLVNALAITTAMFRSLVEVNADAYGIAPAVLWEKFAVSVAGSRAAVDWLPPD